MDTIRARRGHRQRQRHARTEPNRMRPPSRRALLRAFPGSRFRFRKQRRPAFGHACSGSAALTSHSIPSPTSSLFLPHFTRAAPLRAYSQPLQTHHYTYPQYRPPRLHPHSGSTCLFVLGFRIAYKYLLLPSCFAILLSVSGLYALFSFTSFLALYLHSTVFPSPLSLTALPLLVAYTVNLYVCMYICTYAPP